MTEQKCNIFDKKRELQWLALKSVEKIQHSFFSVLILTRNEPINCQ